MYVLLTSLRLLLSLGQREGNVHQQATATTTRGFTINELLLAQEYQGALAVSPRTPNWKLLWRMSCKSRTVSGITLPSSCSSRLSMCSCITKGEERGRATNCCWLQDTRLACVQCSRTEKCTCSGEKISKTALAWTVRGSHHSLRLPAHGCGRRFSITLLCKEPTTIK